MFFDKCVIDVITNIDMSGSSFDVSSANFYYPDRSGARADGSYMIYLKFFLIGDIDKVSADRLVSQDVHSFPPLLNF